jgi:hypothetical protein
LKSINKTTLLATLLAISAFIAFILSLLLLKLQYPYFFLSISLTVSISVLAFILLSNYRKRLIKTTEPQQERLGKLYAAYHVAVIIMVIMTIVFPFAMFFLPSGILPYFEPAFVVIMMGASLVVMAGLLRSWGKIGLLPIIIGMIIGLILIALGLHYL